MEITQELLHELFEYKDGELYWKKYKVNRKMNVPVGTKSSTGRLSVRVYGKHYLIHRMIFLFHRGYLPEFIDHKDNNYLNNRIENLRECTREQNNRNSTIRADNTTGVKCVYPHRNKFIAHLRFNGKQNYLGIFDTIEEAEYVVKRYREEHHGDYAREA
jgi:hypothetical protein